MFGLAGIGAAVTAEAVIVVAGFGGRVDDAVSAPGKAAIETTVAVWDVAVRRTLVALFAFIRHAVAAEGRHETAQGRTTVGQKRAVNGRLALFSEQGLHRAVAAGAAFEEAVLAAAVEVAGVAVVTLFPRIKETVRTAHADLKNIGGHGTLHVQGRAGGVGRG